MSNIIDSIQVSGVQYTLSAQTSGGTFDLPIYSGTGTNALKLNYSGNTASGDYSVAEGYFTSASSYYSHAEGYGTTASSNAHAEGQLTKANGDTSHAEGYATTAKGVYSHAEGQGTSASGNTSHAEGQGTKAIGNTSHAEGNRTSASGQSSHAEGNGSIASGSSSHAEGYQTQANGHYSHAEGQSTSATSYSSHAEGYGTTASGESSHAEGNVTTANGSSSHAEGSYTETNNHAEHASGYYNVSSSGSTALGHSGNTLFSVGNGASPSSRHNAFEIRQNGDIYLSSGGTDIKLQDHLGGGGTVDQTIISGSTNAVAGGAVYDKFDEVEQVTARALNELAEADEVTARALIDLHDSLSGKADTSAITESLATKVNVADNNVSAFSGVPLAINVNENYGSLQLKTIYIKNNDATQHNNVVFGEIKYYNGSYNTKTTISGSSIPQSGITAITNTDTTAHTFTLENGVCRIDFLGSGYLTEISSEGNGFSFYYIHNNNYTSGQSSTVIENTVYDALTELGKDIVDMNDSGRFVNVTKAQDITGQKNFIGDKGIKFSQSNTSNKPGFVIYAVDTANTTTEAATFEFRPNTFTETISGTTIKHPLLYLGHYRTTTIANKGIPQTVIGFRQYDQPNTAAYHMLAPLPDKAKTPFSLTTTYKDFYMPMGFKNGSTMITTDNTGVADFSSVLGGLKLVKLTQLEYDALTTKDDNTVYFIGDSTNGYTMKIGSANVN